MHSNKSIVMAKTIYTEMKTSLTVPPELAPTDYGQTQPDMPVRMVSAFDGNAAFQAAKQICRAVTQNLNDQFDFHEEWFQFSAFTERAGVERAAKAAADADIVFCCPNNPHALPGPLQDWLRLWLARRNQADAALVLLLPSSPEPAPEPEVLGKDFRETARANGITFFVTEYAAEPRPVMESLPTQTPFMFGEDLDTVRVHSSGLLFRHWGINE